MIADHLRFSSPPPRLLLADRSPTPLVSQIVPSLPRYRQFRRDLHDDSNLIVLIFMPLWGVAGFQPLEALISTHSIRRIVVWAAVAVGKTIDVSTFPVGRAARHGRARPESSTMNIASTMLLALAMSTDAFAAAIGKGASLHRPRLREALKTGVIFGVIEAITPLVGWALGRAAAPYVMAWDHWIAFGLLFLLGARMIRSGLHTQTVVASEKPDRHGWPVLVLTGFATSIDAMAVGAGLAFIDVNIVSTAALIGMATMIMVTIGFMVGKVLGVIVGKRAEIAGGFILIAIGSTILANHLGYLRTTG